MQPKGPSLEPLRPGVSVSWVSKGKFGGQVKFGMMGRGGGSKRGFQRLSLSVAVSENTKASKGSDFFDRLGVGAPYWARAHTKKLVSGPMLICYSERAQSVGPARPTSAPSWDGHNACHMARPAPLLIALTLARQLGSETRYVRVVRGSGTRGQSSLLQH